MYLINLNIYGHFSVADIRNIQRAGYHHVLILFHLHGCWCLETNYASTEVTGRTEVKEMFFLTLSVKPQAKSRIKDGNNSCIVYYTLDHC